jgi:hypothetical protein
MISTTLSLGVVRCKQLNMQHGALFVVIGVGTWGRGRDVCGGLGN